MTIKQVHEDAAPATCNERDAFHELAALRRWVPWQRKLKKAMRDLAPWKPATPHLLTPYSRSWKWDKVPHNGSRGLSTTNPTDWMMRAEAQAVAVVNGLDGIGVVMTGGIRIGDYTVVGLDHDDVDFATFEPLFPGYAERSPSMKGLRTFGKRRTEDVAQYKDSTNVEYPGCGHLEIYVGSSARFLTVTSDQWSPGDTIPHIDDAAWQRLTTMKGMKRADTNGKLTATPEIEEGTPLDLTRFNLSEKQQRLLDGAGQPAIDRNAVVHSLIIGLANQGANEGDMLATILKTPALWRYCMDHRGNDEAKALQFAREEISRAWSKSKAGMRPALIGFSEKWRQDSPNVAPNRTPACTTMLTERPLTEQGLATPVPPWPSVIGGFLPLGVVTELDGAHGIGKSTIGLHMALSVATGRDWYGYDLQPGRAVFASKEDPFEIIEQRIQAWLEGFDPDERPALRSAICRNLKIYGCDETEALMLTTSDGRVCSMRDDAIDLIVERWQGAALVVLETASLLHGGDELNEDLLVLVAALKRIASRLKAAVTLVRHISKSAAREGIEDSLVGRGGASFSDAVRSALLLKELTNKEAADEGVDLHKLEGKCTLLKLIHTKANYGEKEEPLFILRRPGLSFQRVEPRGKTVVNGERLLQFMRKRTMFGDAEWSLNRLKGECTQIGVSQRELKGTITHLEATNRIRKIHSSKGGNHVAWVVNQ